MTFEAAHAGFVARRSGDPEWVRALRKDAYEAFAKQGLPTRKDEEWKYTGLRPLTELNVRLGESHAELDAGVLASAIGPDDLALVFVDGALSTAHTRVAGLAAGVTITTVSDAIQRRPDVVRRLVGAKLDSERHPFGLLSAAFLGEGAFVEIAKGVTLDRPLHIVHYATGSSPAEGGAVGAAPADAPAYFPRCLIALAESASAQVVETFLGTGTYVVTHAADFDLAANASLTHVRAQSEAPSALHFSRTQATLARDSRLSTFNFAAGGRLNRNDLDLVLDGPGAEATLDGLYLVRGKQHLDNHTTVDHRVPNATSSQLYKGVLADEGRAVFNGKVFVREGAQQTNAFQLNRNLLLSSDAEIDTKPELQIDADDVKCSHGAAVGQLDADQLFYLESRGLRRPEAERMLTVAFADEVLLKLTVPGVMPRLRRLTMDFFTR